MHAAQDLMGFQKNVILPVQKAYNTIKDVIEVIWCCMNCSSECVDCNQFSMCTLSKPFSVTVELLKETGHARQLF